MTGTCRKKLIEVALPLEAINKESAREKSIRHGHPSTLHLWWARRPLAACRAVLFSSLVDDPDSDPQYQKLDGTVDEEAAGIKRADLFNLIEELVMWDNSNNPSVINSARAEIARCVASRLLETGKLEKKTDIGQGFTAWDLVTKCHCRPVDGAFDSKAGRVRFRLDTTRLPPADVVNKFLAEHAPPVLDPFAGGGSIPLEAQRLGLRAYASDLNPVPVLINKALIEIPPKFAGRPPVNPESCGGAAAGKGKGKKAKSLIENEWPGATGLAEDVRYYGQWMRDEAEKRIGHLYPKLEVTAEMAKERPDLLDYIGQKLTVIAWLWARTVPSPNPACSGAHTPLLRDFWLCTRPNGESWIEPLVDNDGRSFRLAVRRGSPPPEFDADNGTVSRKGGVCLLSGVPMPFSYIRGEACAGRMKDRLVAMVVETGKERVYVPADQRHEAIAKSASPLWKPEGEMPKKHRNFQPPVYGMDTFGDLFTNRQLVALGTLTELVENARQEVLSRLSSYYPREYADAIATYLAFCVDKNTLTNCTQATWQSNPDRLTQAYSRQAIAMTWNYAEANPLSSAGGGFVLTPQSVAEVLERLPQPSPEGHVEQRDATAGPPCDKAVFCTDPPYYDNIAYAELSDFFY